MFEASSIQCIAACGSPGSKARHSILVVEDDPASRSFLQFALQREGYDVLVAEDANSAEQAINRVGISSLDCVVTDYRMPGRTGLELMSWLQQKDPNLGTIIVTAEGERSLIKQSLHDGAADFLDKPIQTERLRASVARTIKKTSEQRKLTESASAIREIGRAQEHLLAWTSQQGHIHTNICFHPKHEAGGDFFTRYQPSAHQVLCLLTDVSGHDAQAAYISAYFQGIVRGMLEGSASVEEIFSTFNRILMQEWNIREVNGEKIESVQASVAACAIMVDSSTATATIVSHGTPAPVYWQADGAATVIGNTGGFPLGWFGELAPGSRVQPMADGGSICLWTDGLEETAKQRGVSELSYAFILQAARAKNEKPPGIENAPDDILVTDICLPFAKAKAALQFRPILVETYEGDKLSEIDLLQAYWKRSLLLAIPDLPDSSLHDILLASREAVLNALQHGCGGRAGEKARFQAAYCSAARTVRLRVCDPGPGHQFTQNETAGAATSDLLEAHRGLELLRHCATAVTVERDGASLILDFTWT